jgi:hypothetical protein
MPTAAAQGFSLCRIYVQKETGKCPMQHDRNQHHQQLFHVHPPKQPGHPMYDARVADDGAGRLLWAGLPFIDTPRWTITSLHHASPIAGTREAIEWLKVATIIEDSAIHVDDVVLDERGFTPLDFDPTK